jgi:hypothetical protein
MSVELSLFLAFRKHWIVLPILTDIFAKKKIKILVLFFVWSIMDKYLPFKFLLGFDIALYLDMTKRELRRLASARIQYYL